MPIVAVDGEPNWPGAGRLAAEGAAAGALGGAAVAAGLVLTGKALPPAASLAWSVAFGAAVAPLLGRLYARAVEPGISLFGSLYAVPRLIAVFPILAVLAVAHSLRASYYLALSRWHSAAVGGPAPVSLEDCLHRPVARLVWYAFLPVLGGPFHMDFDIPRAAAPANLRPILWVILAAGVLIDRLAFDGHVDPLVSMLSMAWLAADHLVVRRHAAPLLVHRAKSPRVATF